MSLNKTFCSVFCSAYLCILSCSLKSFAATHSFHPTDSRCRRQGIRNTRQQLSLSPTSTRQRRERKKCGSISRRGYCCCLKAFVRPPSLPCSSFPLRVLWVTRFKNSTWTDTAAVVERSTYFTAQ